MILQAEDLNKSYGEHKILRHCSLSVRAGECVLLRGPSGGGKSTLLRILALLEDADSGTISHGEQIYRAGALPHNVSAYPFATVVFQQLFLWPNLTVAQNISLVLEKRPNARLSSDTLDMLARFNIKELVHRLPHECSLGERQRVALVRALMSKASFLLLDEPSSALDRSNRIILVEELGAQTARKRGLLVITHDDVTFDKLADRCYELENGYLSTR